jgi:hypothetical protein
MRAYEVAALLCEYESEHNPAPRNLRAATGAWSKNKP